MKIRLQNILKIHNKNQPKNEIKKYREEFNEIQNIKDFQENNDTEKIYGNSNIEEVYENQKIMRIQKFETKLN